jgi:hypothetical protein
MAVVVVGLVTQAVSHAFFLGRMKESQEHGAKLVDALLDRMKAFDQRELDGAQAKGSVAARLDSVERNVAQLASFAVEVTKIGVRFDTFAVASAEAQRQTREDILNVNRQLSNLMTGADGAVITVTRPSRRGATAEG